MIGLSGLVDSLLSAKVSPPMDVLAIKGELEIGAPGPVPRVPKGDNDVRLPSNAALDRLIPAAQTGAAHADGAPRSLQLVLSATARAISALLADLHGDAGPVRGSAPALPVGRDASTARIAGALAQAVSGSGLFYESHLAEFTTGTRTLAALRQEPQAQWSTPAAGRAAPVQAPPMPGGLPAIVGADAIVQALRPASDPTEPAAAAPVAVPAARGEPKPDGAAPASVGVSPLADAEVPPDTARLQAAYRWGEAPVAPIAPPASERAFGRPVAEAAAVRHAGSPVASGGGAPSVSAEAIHPQAVTLVHQQLDLLATAVFRWSGEAWPGVAMDWSIHEERTDREPGRDEASAPRPWSTTVALTLPRLGDVELRLSLIGPSVTARLSASQASTTARMRADRGLLAERLASAGLRLQDLQISEKRAS